MVTMGQYLPMVRLVLGKLTLLKEVLKHTILEVLNQGNQMFEFLEEIFVYAFILCVLFVGEGCCFSRKLPAYVTEILLKRL